MTTKKQSENGSKVNFDECYGSPILEPIDLERLAKFVMLLYEIDMENKAKEAQENQN